MSSCILTQEISPWDKPFTFYIFDKSDTEIGHYEYTMKLIPSTFDINVLAPVPLSIFQSNSKFDENSERSSFRYTQAITTIFCTRHDSDTVVTCAKYRCDRPRIFLNFHRISNSIEICLVGRAPGVESDSKTKLSYCAVPFRLRFGTSILPEYFRSA